MKWYSVLFMISAVIAALGFIGAIVTFFAFDIRSIYAIRSGKTKKKEMQESRMQYAAADEQKQNSADPADAPRGKRNRSAQFKSMMNTEQAPVTAESAPVKAEPVSGSDIIAAAMEELAGASMPTAPLAKKEKPAQTEKMTGPVATPGFRFEMIEDTVVTHTDEIVY